MIDLLKFLKKITFDSNAFAFRKLVAPRWPKRRKRKVICSLIDEVISVLGVSLPNERAAAHSNLAITKILHH